MSRRKGRNKKPTKAQGTRKQQDGPQAHPNTSPAAPVKHAVETTHSPVRSGPREQQSSPANAMQKIERLQAWFNGFLVLFAFIGIVVSIFQWCAMREQSAEMLKQSKTTQEQLEAMVEQNKI